VAHVKPTIAGLVPPSTRVVADWFGRRTITEFPSPRSLIAAKRAQGLGVSVAIPTLNEAATIGPICETVGRLVEAGLVDELVVLDGESTDDTDNVARAAGATIIDVASILPGITPAGGKGESLWRSLAVLSGDIVVWIDADIRNFDEHFVTRLVAPLVLDEQIAFVKGFYRRPMDRGGALTPDEGGRVTELLARPLLACFFPELTGFLQPLAGEYAGRADVLRRLPFMTGYSVEAAMLIDLLHDVGLDAMAQVNLSERVHRNRPLSELGPMAYAIARTILQRAEKHGRAFMPIEPPAALLVPGGEGLEAREVNELERPAIEAILGRATVAAARV
jgi:glucosyl-3-phosphoglycerate synthase